MAAGVVAETGGDVALRLRRTVAHGGGGCAVYIDFCRLFGFCGRVRGDVRRQLPPARGSNARMHADETKTLLPKTSLWFTPGIPYIRCHARVPARGNIAHYCPKSRR